MLNRILALLVLASACSLAAPIRSTSFTQIVIWEATSAPQMFTFTPNGAAATTRIGGTLTSSNADFIGAPTELYDVFYSDADGTFNIDGEFLTIEGNYEASSGSGFNISFIGLDVNSVVFGATSVVSFVLGQSNTGNPASVANVVDNDTNTWTSLGRTLDPSQRIRLTVTFATDEESSEVPEPSTYGMILAGAGAIFAVRRRRRAL